jgi:hypothetical protein
MDHDGCLWTSGDVDRLIEQLEAEPLTEMEQSIVRRRFELYAHVKVPDLPALWCPCCGSDELRRADACAHLVTCEWHPARVRYQALARVAAHALPPTLSSTVSLTFPVSPPDDFARAWPVAEALQALGKPSLSKEERTSAARSVQRELRWRMHVAERETDPCPWCSGVFPLEVFVDHLVTCAQHPGARGQLVLSDALIEHLGEAGLQAALAEDREQQARAVLEHFIKACRAYAHEMGVYDDGHYYSKVWSEKPWRRASLHASAFVRSEGAASMSPAMARTVLALRTLLQRSLEFWNRMGDDGEGRSLIRIGDSDAWDADVQAAALALEP